MSTKKHPTIEENDRIPRYLKANVTFWALGYPHWKIQSAVQIDEETVRLFFRDENDKAICKLFNYSKGSIVTSEKSDTIDIEEVYPPPQEEIKSEKNGVKFVKY